MSYEAIKEWLDAHVAHFKESHRINVFNGQISANISQYVVLMYEGIELIADIMGLQLACERGTHYTYGYSFVYDGVKFLQISDEPLRQAAERSEHA